MGSFSWHSLSLAVRSEVEPKKGWESVTVFIRIEDIPHCSHECSVCLTLGPDMRQSSIFQVMGQENILIYLSNYGIRWMAQNKISVWRCGCCHIYNYSEQALQCVCMYVQITSIAFQMLHLLTLVRHLCSKTVISALIWAQEWPSLDPMVLESPHFLSFWHQTYSHNVVMCGRTIVL